MKICPACKAENENSAKFCLVCGRILTGAEIVEDPVREEEPAPGTPEEEKVFEEPVREEPPREEPKPEPEPEKPFEEPAPEEKPEEEPELKEEPAPAKKEKTAGVLTTGQYFLLEALFAIPVVGIVCLFIFSLSHPKNDSLRRFSASVLIWRLILCLVLFVLFAIFLFNFKEWGPALAARLNTFEGVVIH